MILHTIKVLSQMSKWFSANKQSLNLGKTNVIKFVTKTYHNIHTLHTEYNNKYIEEAVNTKFLGLQIANHLGYLHCKRKLL
jgi:hypothetical protein